MLQTIVNVCNFAFVIHIDKEKRVYFTSLWLSKLINFRKKNRLAFFKRILIIRIDEIGDMVVSLPAIDLVIENFPNAEITVWCKSLPGQLLREKPGISKVVDSQSKLEGKYDLIIELRGNWETLKFALNNRPILRLDRGTIRFKNKFANKGIHPHEVITALQVVEPVVKAVPGNPKLTIHLPTRNQQTAAIFLQRNVINRFAIVHIGAGKKLRRWSLSKFTALAKHLKEAYFLEIIFAGSNQDLNHIEKIQKDLGFQSFTFIGDYSLLDYAALSAKADIMIGNESGPMHISAASGTKVIALFGPGEPAIFKPWSDKAITIHHKLDCNPCNQIDCVIPNNPCINHITVDEVIDAVRKLLK